MTRDELMQIGHDAGFDTSELKGEIIALLECVSEHAAATERAARQESQAMADCLDMLRTDLIAAGVVGPEVAPMFLTEAVLSAVSLERTARIEAQQRLADMQELAAFRADGDFGMSAATEPRWYCVNNMGMATLCADKSDAEDVASECDIAFPRQAPHRAVQLVEVSELDNLHAEIARLTAENEALRAVVAEAVREALHEAKKACENLPAPEACSGVERSLWGVATMACAEAVGKVGAT